MHTVHYLSLPPSLLNVSHSDTALLGMCLTDKGQFHLIVGDGRAALACFKKALSISRKVHGEDDIQVNVLSLLLHTLIIPPSRLL